MSRYIALLMLSITSAFTQTTIPFDESQYIIKDIHYDYDLISGKVNQVTYQGGEADQLKHRYEYDGDNRITAVYTSTDGINWTKEAAYEYYAHGPLAKTELGAQKVETQTNAYTLQGWVKGMQGQNFSYALGYNDQDYKAIGNDPTGGMLNTPIATTTGGVTQNPTSTTQNLYNGNIATWHTNTPALALKNVADMTNQYTYDQLNRIKSSTVVGKGNAYKTGYQYDANGNILDLQRYNETAQKFDAFRYNYEDKKSGYLANTNKLRSVDDTITDKTLHTEDLEDQEIDNYQYDDIGNLNYDRQEEIDKIEWTVYGKVKAVYRKAGSLKPNLLFEYDATGNRTGKTAIANSGTITKTHYIRDASGNVMATYTSTGGSSLALQEQYLYGSSRLGVLENGNRSYELTDHLGNVRVVLSEFKEVKAAYEYYAFGMSLAKIDNGYRYGFNGKEKDAEGTGGGGSTYDYGMRIYNPQLGKFLSIDPLTGSFPWYTPYQFAGNDPIRNIDLDGEEELDYMKFREGMIKGAESLKNVPFPRQGNDSWHQKKIVYVFNKYWKASSNKNALEMRENVSPSQALRHIIDHPRKYRMDCAWYVQTAILYGMLNSMGDEEFNKFIKEKGNFTLQNHQSIGNNNSEILWFDVEKNTDSWYHGYSKGKEDKKNFRFHRKGYNSVDVDKIIASSPIGTRVNLFSEFLKGTFFEKENIVKVGNDQYLAQGLGDGVLSMQQIKESLVKKAYGDKLSETEMKDKVASIKVIAIEYSSERKINNEPKKE